ncbi:MAG: hypothetical protein SFU25_05500 [Candidatus Caenarcaniphilales bacterium]|nr:hypothetical protein [Candidatus Caenarcaniphilales bacterium]
MDLTHLYPQRQAQPQPYTFNSEADTYVSSQASNKPSNDEDLNWFEKTLIGLGIVGTVVLGGLYGYGRHIELKACEQFIKDQNSQGLEKVHKELKEFEDKLIGKLDRDIKDETVPVISKDLRWLGKKGSFVRGETVLVQFAKASPNDTDTHICAVPWEQSSVLLNENGYLRNIVRGGKIISANQGVQSPKDSSGKFQVTSSSEAIVVDKNGKVYQTNMSPFRATSPGILKRRISQGWKGLTRMMGDKTQNSKKT